MRGTGTVPVWFSRPEGIHDQNYSPYLAVVNGRPDRLIVLGSAKAGKLQQLLVEAGQELDRRRAATSATDILTLLGDASVGRAASLLHFHDILYLPICSSAVAPRYSHEMQLVFLVGVLRSQRHVVFCTDIRYNLYRLGSRAPVLGMVIPTGERLQEGLTSLDAVQFIWDRRREIGLHVGGTVLELYGLCQHGYNFCFSQDAQLVAIPPTGGAAPDLTVLEWVGRGLRRALTPTEVNSVKEAVMTAMRRAISQPRMASTADELIHHGLVLPSSGPVP